MEKEYKKTYRSEPSVHKINVFHITTSYRFFHMSCEECKLQNKCHDIQHKREICMVAKQTEKFLLPFTDANVSSFASDEFYIFINRKNKKQQLQLKNILGFLTVKYMTKYNEH